MLAIEAALSVAFIMLFKDLHDWLGNDMDARRWQMTGPAAALCLSLGFASIVKSRLLAKVLGQPVSGWRWDLLWAAAAGLIVGIPVRIFLPEWAELALGIPLILGAFCAVLWYKGFGPEDRELFKLRKAEIEDLATASEADKDRV
jgi:hypothetical protein